MADKTATYSIRVDTNAREAGKGGAEGLEALKTSAGQSQEAIRYLSASLSKLKGSSDEVKSAKSQLGAQLEAERGKLTQTTLALAKQGTSLDQLAAKEKAAGAAATKLAAEQEKARAKVDASVRAAGGPVAALRERFKGLDEAMATSEGRSALFAKSIAGIAGLAAAGAVAIVGMATALGVAVVGLGRWVVEMANAQRALSLQREAWTGSATGATHLGNQIDALARKVPTARAELQALSGELVRALSGSRVSGQGIVDTFNAVSQAASAMGDQAGAKIREIIERAKQFGRVQINPFELQGTGIGAQDVARALSERLHVGIAEAQKALLLGRVKVDDAAAALRGAIEKRFATINAKKLLSLDAQLERFKENLAKLASKVNLEPVLKGLASFGRLFDTSTVGGARLQTIITTIGTAIGNAFSEKNVNKVKTLFLEAELLALKSLIGIYKIDNAVGRVFGKDWKGKIFGGALEGAGKQVEGLIRMVERLESLLDRVSGGGAEAGKGKIAVQTPAPSALAAQGRKSGQAVADGVAAGIASGSDGVNTAMSKLAGGLVKTFEDKLKIHSPSVVMRDDGRNTAKGAELGIKDGTPGVQRATERMAPKPGASAAAPAGGGKGGGGARSSPVVVNVNITAPPGAGAKELSSPSFLRGLTKAIEDALTASGLPIQTEPQS